MATQYPRRLDELIDHGPTARAGKRWQVDVFLHPGPGGRKRPRFRTRAEAEAERDRLRKMKTTSGRKPSATAGSGSRTNTAELWEKFRASPRVRRTGLRNQADLAEQWENLVRPKWALNLLDRITHKQIEEWAHELATEPAPGRDRPRSVKRQRDALALLTRMLAYAVSEQMIPDNQAYRPGGGRDYMPRIPGGSGDGAKHALTARQLNRLADAEALARWRDLILFAGTTGLRWQEWARLEVADINTHRRTVTVTKALSTVRGQGHSFRGRAGLIDGPTKTHETRTVPVTAEVLALIRPRLTAPADQLVFNIKGKPIAHTTLAKAMRDASADAGTAVARLQAALGLEVTGYADEATISGVPAAIQAAGERLGEAKAKLSDQHTGKELRDQLATVQKAHDDDVAAWRGLRAGDEDFRPLAPHGLRHTAITALINSGVPVTTVARWAGHRSPTVTLDTYSHLYA